MHGTISFLSHVVVAFPWEPCNNSEPASGECTLAKRKAVDKPRTFSADAARNLRRPFKSRQYTLALFNVKVTVTDHPFPFHTRMREESIHESGSVTEAMHNWESFLNPRWIPQITSFWSESNSKNLGISLHCFPNSPSSQRGYPSSATASVTMLLQLYSWDGFKVHICGSHFVQIPALGPLGYSDFGAGMNLCA